MNFLWSDQSIRWFLDASSYTGFHKELAGKIAPYLEPSDTLGDIGCGLGRIDLELAPHVTSLTAIDINEVVIAQLQYDANRLELHNLHARCADVTALADVFDVVIMSFFGKSVTESEYRQFCRRRAIRIVNAENSGHLYPDNHRQTSKDTAPMVQYELEKQGYRYQFLTHTIEFGQPLRSWQDAEQFVLYNAPKITAEESCTFLQENATQTGRSDFPIYIPNPKDIGIFVIHCD
ncbi:MAG: class I SAM-dependent methyltransferase [Dehalococcoidia bacterium]|nr:class I SAM-dependent methyltransferase [Dehalococcoidia bacterium]